ncbi:unnamed protein product [Owenia fusiformis]|uniref:Uncharacterized protein n=1 Tax=Owenia fusiformis TaxID=6347 RepID=A0A8J1UE84_OWEFU|nr:unnamed protein product [Owenia fusiformis]
MNGGTLSVNIVRFTMVRRAVFYCVALLVPAIISLLLLTLGFSTDNWTIYDPAAIRPPDPDLIIANLTHVTTEFILVAESTGLFQTCLVFKNVTFVRMITDSDARLDAECGADMKRYMESILANPLALPSAALCCPPGIEKLDSVPAKCRLDYREMSPCTTQYEKPDLHNYEKLYSTADSISRSCLAYTLPSHTPNNCFTHKLDFSFTSILSTIRKLYPEKSKDQITPIQNHEDYSKRLNAAILSLLAIGVGILLAGTIAMALILCTEISPTKLFATSGVTYLLSSVLVLIGIASFSYNISYQKAVILTGDVYGQSVAERLKYNNWLLRIDKYGWSFYVTVISCGINLVNSMMTLCIAGHAKYLHAQIKDESVQLTGSLTL